MGHGARVTGTSYEVVSPLVAALCQQGNLQSARAIALELSSISPGPLAKANLARCLLSTGECEPALTMLRQAIAQHEDNGTPDQNLAIINSLLGEALLAQERHKAAYASLQEAADYFATDDSTYTYLDNLRVQELLASFEK